jgi:hypothetical protein
MSENELKRMRYNNVRKAGGDGATSSVSGMRMYVAMAWRDKQMEAGALEVMKGLFAGGYVWHGCLTHCPRH